MKNNGKDRLTTKNKNEIILGVIQVENTIKSLKMTKTAGQSGIAPRLIKHNIRNCTKRLTEYFREMYLGSLNFLFARHSSLVSLLVTTRKSTRKSSCMPIYISDAETRKVSTPTFIHFQGL